MTTRTFCITAAAALLVSAVLVWWGLDSGNPGGDRPRVALAETSLAALDGVSGVRVGRDGVRVESTARRAEVERDFRHLLSFVGQYRIVAEDVDVRVTLPDMPVGRLSGVLAGIGREIAVFPANWNVFGSPDYVNVRVRFYHAGTEILAVRADKAGYDRDGRLLLRGIRSPNALLDGRSYLRLELPLLVHVLHAQMDAQTAGEG